MPRVGLRLVYWSFSSAQNIRWAWLPGFFEALMPVVLQPSDPFLADMDVKSFQAPPRSAIHMQVSIIASFLTKMRVRTI